MYLYPKLPNYVAQSIAQDIAGLDVVELINRSNTEHPKVVFTTSGGNRADHLHMIDIQEKIRKCGEKWNYLSTADSKSLKGFDQDSSKILLENLKMRPFEACQGDTWAFFGCVLLPDLVRWRFFDKDKPTTLERFTGGKWGLRNTFGRLWWRAYILADSTKPDPYFLLNNLGEDELVQITERPSIAGNTKLAKSFCNCFLQTHSKNSSLDRSLLFRDSIKRLRRNLPIMAFESMNEKELEAFLENLFTESVDKIS
jgi:hypothetical protein